jgi:ribosome-associated translation inhibitor RaiA
LDELDRATAEQAIAGTYDKLEKIINNVIYLTVHVKSHEADGLRKKYSVHCRLSTGSASGAMFISNSIKKWKFLTALQDALRTLERDVLKSVKRLPYQ